MTILIALFRAINVGGTGKLPMADLRELCTDLGFTEPRTYIQSGNVVLGSKVTAAAAKAKLEKAISARLGKPFRVLVRTAAEVEAAVDENPFPDAEPHRLLIMFLDDAPPKDALKDIRIPGGERLQLRGRELYIHFPDGMGKSKLKIPFADVGTGRNLNTVRALLKMAR